MLDEMLLAGELQEPSKKVFYTFCFAFCVCFLSLHNQCTQLYQWCCVHAGFASYCCANLYVCFVWFVIQSHVNKIADTVIWKSAVIERVDEIPTAKLERNLLSLLVNYHMKLDDIAAATAVLLQCFCCCCCTRYTA